MVIRWINYMTMFVKKCALWIKSVSNNMSGSSGNENAKEQYSKSLRRTERKRERNKSTLYNFHLEMIFICFVKGKTESCHIHWQHSLIWRQDAKWNCWLNVWHPRTKKKLYLYIIRIEFVWDLVTYTLRQNRVDARTYDLQWWNHQAKWAHTKK